ncbi:MAG TPA: DUF1800 domain-containing protein [Pirellulales bacterium]
MTQHLRPWAPSQSRPFDVRAAAHLLRRAGFGASPADIAKAVDQGLEATVDGLFDPAADEEAEFERTLAAVQDGFVNFDDISYVQGWWLYRMLRTRVPLKEKLTLFWHGHFATSYLKVDDAYLMHRQIQMLRALGAGSFRDLVLAVAKDPAMLVYLDGASSGKEHPNENFARELMELFTCGIGHYGEQDVLEAARAFTGWYRNSAGSASFNADEHDAGRKQFLGLSGRFDGADIIDILMQQPATPRWIAGKLLNFFASPDPAADVLDEAAGLLDRTQMNIKWFLRELFLSDYFFSKACYRQQIASPAEYVVGTIRTLRAHVSGSNLLSHMETMGQTLLEPPNVKGWDGQRKWINSSTWTARLEFANFFAMLDSNSPVGDRLDLKSLVPDDLAWREPGLARRKSPERVVAWLADVLLQGELDDASRSKLATLLVTGDDGENREAFRDDADFRHQRIRAVLAAMLSLPAYHTC